MKNTLEDVRNWLDSRTDIEITNLSTGLNQEKEAKIIHAWKQTSHTK
ncbi:hypothetical protein J7E73_09895 [Paenibacillus albidus]|nr:MULTISPECIES: hypothetical protein [Paenibacillus]MBT2289437.1 hypothetical protein [Paenibacillus albidus]